MQSQQEQLLDLLHAVQRSLHDMLRSTFEDVDFPFMGLLMLKRIHQRPGVTVSELAREIGLAKSHISKTVDVLAERGLVDKRSDPGDQRLQRLYPTPAAEAQLEEGRSRIRNVWAGVTEAVPPAKMAPLIEGLEALLGAMRELKGKGQGE
jgi:DNA-binding MarR family transcriptional regulator